MKIAVFGRKFDKSFEANLQVFFKQLCEQNVDLFIYKPFYEFLKTSDLFKTCSFETFNNYNQITSDFDFFFSLGGDGTFLEAVQYVRDTGIPIIGINTGNLGFLANISQEEIRESLENIFSGNYGIEKRSLIAFNSPENPFSDFPYGLNEVTVQKHDTSLITIDAEVNGNYLNTYRTDGLIISTPTGSTAYTMSVGGPILAPDCQAIIISPIASHNLTVRPIVITDNIELKLNIQSRTGHFVVTIDSRFHKFSSETPIILKMAGFSINMAHLPNHTFYSTIRKKLMWGADIRN